tara:strand:- start:911 stop:2671 length:1761 start_codon:yes stop_codon:yes gene_type:complete
MSDSALKYLHRLREDMPLYFQHCLKVKNFGSGELVPFEMNEVQVILHYMCEQQLKEDEHVRFIVLKARRFGISTYIQARFFRHATMNFNKTVQITTHSAPATDTMFGMTRAFEENYPKEIKPSKKYSGKRELVFGTEQGGLNSQYSLSTVGGKEVRGSAIDYLHCSEVASWGEGGEDYFLGLVNCVIAGYQTEVFVESTAQGVGGLFYNLFWDAYNGKSGFKPAFFPWFIYSHYTKAFKSNLDKLKFENSLGQDKRYGAEEETKLLGHSISYDVGGEEPLRFEIDLEKLHWRRMYIDTQTGGDLLRFHQEFPTHPREAFISTGRSFFSAEALNDLVLESEHRLQNKPPRYFHVPVQKMKSGGDPLHLLEEDEEGEFTVWREPQKGHQYRIGVDVSEGLEVSNRDTDYSVAVVLDAESYQEQAMLRLRIDPDLLAWQLKTIGRWYNDAMMLVERNNHGLVTLKYLQDIHAYPSIYTEKVLDERSNRSQKKIGFHTTVKSKPLILDFLRELIREREIEIFSPALVDELQTFVMQPNGKMSAQHGSHDDCVMALAIATFGCRMYPHATVEPSRYNFHRPAFNLFNPPSS